jgi:phosphohistidine phosphatase
MPRETPRRVSPFIRSDPAPGHRREGNVKRLLLLRHAKAVPHGTMNDFDRVLAEQGRRDMEFVGRHLQAVRPKPDLALVSPAARTRETWALCRLSDVPVRFEETIYEGHLDALLRLVRALPDEVSAPILVGHNPSLEDFAASLAPEDGPRALPTAALVLASWDAASWRDLRPGEGRIEEVVTPAALGAPR